MMVLVLDKRTDVNGRDGPSAGPSLASIDNGNYADAMNQLGNDIIMKMDGCASTGAPDKNVWITTESKSPSQSEIQQACQQQSFVYPLLLDAKEYIANFLP